MLQAFLNSLKIGEVRNKILWTIGLIAVYRLGCHIVVPGADPIAIKNMADQGGWLQLADMFSGGAFSRFAIFALGIMPYISASIIFQLLTPVIPRLEELKKEGQQGQNQLNQYKRYLTVALCAIQGMGLAVRAESLGVAPSTWQFRIMAVSSLTAGGIFIMWLGEQISEYGIGNGISLLIYVSIVSSIPQFFVGAFQKWSIGEFNPLDMAGLFVLLGLLFVICVWIQTGERRVPVKYTKQVRGRKMYGGQGSHLPLKVDYSGVIAVIFASSAMMFPALMFGTLIGNAQTPYWLDVLISWFERGSMLWALIYTGLIVFFCYFYTGITFNPNDVAENLKESGGIVPGRRPGKNTAEYIEKILNRITLVGSLVVAFIAILPIWMSDWFGVRLYFGGTSLLILVGVGLDFVQKLESQLLMRHYDGFMESGTISGRGFGG
ncbi:MAG: preprotein translocase subunit SecY [bacterium]